MAEYFGWFIGDLELTAADDLLELRLATKAKRQARVAYSTRLFARDKGLEVLLMMARLRLNYTSKNNYIKTKAVSAGNTYSL